MEPESSDATFELGLRDDPEFASREWLAIVNGVILAKGEDALVVYARARQIDSNADILMDVRCRGSHGCVT